ncbi:hypothetical protein [Actinoplanes sp. N902-109]|uniref:hypothetical protein n=1 Tax=Actinoplanes sp. (strain N902-109) TaxID=649831 RepID=UPI0003295D65|nr:hypothetical protein [Actinoplanes sp. N902-109]AGL13854.1 hypothetical protein L083_0344 [Actinoplanes sp. N902-109]
MNLDDLHVGDLLDIGPGAGVAITPGRYLLVRVNTWQSWDGMAWLDVRPIQPNGRPGDERIAYVGLAGLTVARTAADIRADRLQHARQMRAAYANARIPGQRPASEPTRRRGAA